MSHLHGTVAEGTMPFSLLVPGAFVFEYTSVIQSVFEYARVMLNLSNEIRNMPICATYLIVRSSSYQVGSKHALWQVLSEHAYLSAGSDSGTKLEVAEFLCVAHEASPPGVGQSVRPRAARGGCHVDLKQTPTGTSLLYPLHTQYNLTSRAQHHPTPATARSKAFDSGLRTLCTRTAA
eukprot:3936061-Rhodomonas_salina.2